MHVQVFLAEWLFVLALLVGAGAVGGFVVIPFRSALPFAVMCAPFAGLLVLALGACVAYNVLGLPLAPGLLGTALVGFTATTVSALGTHLRPRPRALAGALALTGAVTAAATSITNPTTIALGEPAILYAVGTDHLGYAHLADWMINHPPWDRPRADPTFPYESWPELLFQIDPRFGAFDTVALIALLRGLPAMFAFDPTCAAVFSAGILAVVGTYARSRFTLAILIIGLLTSHWYDFSRLGFLGRLFGFPAAFFVAGMFMVAISPLRAAPLTSILLAMSAAAVVFWAEVPTLFVGAIGGLFILARTVFALGGSRQAAISAIAPHLAALGLMGVLAAVMRAFVARPPHSPGVNEDFTVLLQALIKQLLEPGEGIPIEGPPLFAVMLTLADLEHYVSQISRLESEVLLAALLASGAAWLGLAALAWQRRLPVAIGLTCGPMLLLAALLASSTPTSRWMITQIPGTFYPLALCAAATLIDSVRPAADRAGPRWGLLASSLVVLTVISIGLRVPRFVGALELYVAAARPPVQPELRFSQSEMDGLASAIGGNTVMVDIEHPNLSIVTLVELGRRGLAVEWSERSYKYVLGYRPWTPSLPYDPPDLVLQASTTPADEGADIIYQTRPYRLVRR